MVDTVELSTVLAALNLPAAEASSNADGGGFVLSGGEGDGTGNGGGVMLRSGDGGVDGGSGGGAELSGGISGVGGNGGNAYVKGGSGTFPGGAFINGGDAVSGSGNKGGAVAISGGLGDGVADSGDVWIEIQGNATLKIYGLPTSNPNSANALWNDAGTLKISAG